MPETAIDRVTYALQRLGETEPRLHAYVHTFAEQATTAARALDQEAPRGPLHGIPFAVKEVFDVAGVETRGGSKAFAGRIPDADAAVVRRLRQAGAVLLGTQVSHELTCGLDEPPTRNPWDLRCYPGGSSAGAGVSVAVGSAAFALGTDAAGSVRIPAAMTGVVGFKPSMGAVSKQGVMRGASAPSIDNVGIVARSVSLVRDVFGTILFADPADAATLQQRPRAEEAGGAEFSGRRIAVLGGRTLAAVDLIHPREDDIVNAFAETCRRLREMGAVLVEVELPLLAGAGGIVTTFFAQELAIAHRAGLGGGKAQYHPAVREMLGATLAALSEGLDDAVARRAQLAAEVERELARAGVEALLTPTTPRTAMPLVDFRPEAELGTLIPYTCGFNLTGHPAISLPNGLDRNGLPIGLQIVGRLGGDLALLSVAARCEGLAPRRFSPL